MKGEREGVRFTIPPGTPETTCKSCGAPIVWVLSAKAKRMPLNLDGVTHFATCPHADEHRKPRGVS